MLSMCAPDIANDAIAQVRDALPGARVTVVLALVPAVPYATDGIFGKSEPMICLTKLDECAAGPAEFFTNRTGRRNWPADRFPRHD